jgi:hypothetical protein
MNEAPAIPGPRILSAVSFVHANPEPVNASEMLVVRAASAGLR